MAVQETYLLDGLEVWNEEVSVIVGHFVLQYRYQSLQTHAGINALLGQGFQGSITLPTKVR